MLADIQVTPHIRASQNMWRLHDCTHENVIVITARHQYARGSCV